jgi:hypothetical protein
VITRVKRGCGCPVNAIGPSVVLESVERHCKGANGVAVAGNRDAVGVFNERERSASNACPRPMFAL